MVFCYGNCDAGRTCAEVEYKLPASPGTEKIDGVFDEGFGFRTGDEDAVVDVEIKSVEFTMSGEVSRGLAV